MKQTQMHRRTLLRGAGGILIGLPLLEEMILPAAATDSQVSDTSVQCVLWFRDSRAIADRRI